MPRGNPIHSFYPHGGPSKYAYTSSFGDELNRNKTAQEAKANTMYPGLVDPETHKFRILYNLEILMKDARRAELAFLASTGINISSEQVAKSIFQNFNLILNSEQLFKRNLDILKNISEGSKEKLLDPTKYFHTYLNQAIREHAIAKNFNIKQASAKQLEKMLDKIMGDALEKTYKKCQEVIDKEGKRRILSGSGDSKQRGEKYTHDFKEMIDVIKKLKNTGIFGKYGYLFDLENTLYGLANEEGVVVDKPSYTIYSTDQGGTPLEIITSAVAPEFARIHLENHSPGGTITITGEHTGSAAYNQQKGDTFIAYAKSQVDLTKMQPYFKNQRDQSERVNNIKALEEYLSTVGDAIEHLLVVSDKNYTITADWGGASAQDKMTLENAKTMLSVFGVSGVFALIDFLANCGADMIQGESNIAEIRNTLTSYIAYFLFDHVEIKGYSTGPNVVNIINLNNTYIPLSVFLEGVYNSLSRKLNGQKGYDYLVKVKIDLGGTEPSEVWTSASWAEFRQGREQKSFISYHILMDIADFITGLMA